MSVHNSDWIGQTEQLKLGRKRDNDIKQRKRVPSRNSNHDDFYTRAVSQVTYTTASGTTDVMGDEYDHLMGEEKEEKEKRGGVVGEDILH